MHPRWLAREEQIRRSVLVEKMNDFDLAERYSVSPMTIRGVRSAFGLPMNPIHPEAAVVPPPAPPVPIATYEENGLTIKRYPPGYALGSLTTPCTARPRR